MTAVIQMLPHGQYSPIDLDKFLVELELRFKQKEVLHTKEAAAFLGVAERTLYRLPKETVPYHKIEGLEGRLYLRSELIDLIRKS